MTCGSHAAERKVIRSAKRGFLVTGSDSAELLSVSRWAEDVADDIERTMRVKMGFGSRRILRIDIRTNEELPEGRVRGQQRFLSGQLEQRIRIENADNINWEDALEVYSKLLLNGYVVLCQTEPQRAKSLGEVPDWLAVGLVQHIDPALRARNRKIVLSWREDTGLPAFAEFLEWHDMSTGRQREKALCGMVVAWLCSRRESSGRWSSVFQRLADGEGISEEWLAANVVACGSVPDMAGAWSRWIDHQQRIITDLGSVSTLLMGKLRRRLVLRSGEPGVPAPAGVAEEMGFDVLVQRKKERWIPNFCKSREEEIKLLGAGRPAEFVTVTILYGDFLKAMQKRKRDQTLIKLLAKADKALDELAATVRAREQYVNLVERLHAVPSGAIDDSLSDSSVFPALGRSPLQRYVDGALQLVEEEGL